MVMGYCRKKNKWRGMGWGGGGRWLRTYFFETPWNFYSFTLPLDIPRETKLDPWNFHNTNFCQIPWKFQDQKQTPGNSTLFFLGHAWKFHFIFNYPLEVPYAVYLLLLVIPQPQPPPSPFFFWNSSIFRGFIHFFQNYWRTFQNFFQLPILW